MIGNDIVDLSQAAKDSNWKRPRFLDKVFTTEEQSLIRSSKFKNQTVWLLWSMKEAAYKAYVRDTNHQFFNPKRVRCQLGLPGEGFVCIHHRSYVLKSSITSEYIHSVARNITLQQPENQIFKLLDTRQNVTVKTQIVTYIASKQGKTFSSISIKKTEFGVPNLFINNKQVFGALSISHHGKYGAFAIY